MLTNWLIKCSNGHGFRKKKTKNTQCTFPSREYWDIGVELQSYPPLSFTWLPGKNNKTLGDVQVRSQNVENKKGAMEEEKTIEHLVKTSHYTGHYCPYTICIIISVYR